MASKKKSSKGRQKSKAALETERRQQVARGGSSLAEQGPKSGGMMTRMRGGFQNAVGNQETEEKGSIFGKILWTLVFAAAIFFFARGM